MYLTLGSHILCRKYGGPIFWKVKRIYILSRRMEADILESKKDLYFAKVKKDLYLVQKYGGRYFGK